MSDSDPDLTYLHTIKKLQELNLGILHLIETAKSASDSQSLAAKARKVFSGMLVLNAGDDQQSAEAAIREGRADAISFGSLFIANPDLPVRFANGWPLAAPDRATFYGGTERGYTDYPKFK